MFGLLKKKINYIKAPISGKCIDISEVNDTVFSQKMMGDGIAIQPTSNIVVAPCNGIVTMIFPTKHAFGITLKSGVEILVHIGIDTVNLEGVGFTCYVKKGQKITQGNKIISFDENYLNKDNLDMTTMVILTNAKDKIYTKCNIGNVVSIQDVIFME